MLNPHPDATSAASAAEWHWGGQGQPAEGKKEYTEAEKNACSLEAVMNGEECEACQ